MQAFVDNVDPENGLDALVKELKDVKCDPYSYGRRTEQTLWVT